MGIFFLASPRSLLVNVKGWKGRRVNPPFPLFLAIHHFLPLSPFSGTDFPDVLAKRKRSQKVVSQRTGNESKCFFPFPFLRRPLLKDVKKSGEIHVVLDCSTDKVQSVLKQAQQVKKGFPQKCNKCTFILLIQIQVGMMTAYHNYLITSLVSANKAIVSLSPPLWIVSTAPPTCLICTPRFLPFLSNQNS